MLERALILIEGIGNTSPLYVRSARRLGLRPLALSAGSSRHDYLAAEGIEPICVDTDDLDALSQQCARLQASYDIAGITCAGDQFYPTVGKLCRRFDLPGPNPDSIERCLDKYTQRELLAKADVPIPAYRLAANAGEVEHAAAAIGLPVIVKPTTGSGSVGVRLCRNLDEVAEHTSYLLSGNHIWPSSPRVLIEEFALGPYYLAHIMGDKIIGIEGGDSGPPPYFVFRESIFPAPLTDEEQESIADVSLSCLQALDLGWGPTCIEFRWTMRGPVVIEVNPRLGGGPSPQLIQLAYGVDLITEHVKLAIGEEWDLRRRHSQAAAARLLVADRDGILEWNPGDSRATALSDVAEVKFYVEPNTPIVRKGDYRDWIGHIIAASLSPAQTEATLQRAVDLIDWSITPFRSTDTKPSADP
ncbi:acetyl-CoA carboxylase biotin carboxylase subunit family protein [Mesorhizobium sp. M0092]|uniref:ATP-grasp domain-containing protein n=1 Tax=Mesorhizobium sp. M0092 TaxID=2956876 RepID=UPI00333969BD